MRGVVPLLLLAIGCAGDLANPPGTRGRTPVYTPPISASLLGDIVLVDAGGHAWIPTGDSLARATDVGAAVATWMARSSQLALAGRDSAGRAMLATYDSTGRLVRRLPLDSVGASAGYGNVYWYRGGHAAWRAAGLPLVPMAEPGRLNAPAS